MPSSTNLPAGQMQLSLEPQRRVYLVNELNAAVQRLFEEDFRSIYVAGEISGCRLAASGHYYFSLKDEQSQIKCALFKGAARLARFKPQDGLAVIARGHLEVYQARGEYQLIVEMLEPQGAGALQVAFEQLKKRLAAEGLFDAARKRPLPRLPRRIGIITSASGAVVRDILHVIERRFPGLHVRLFSAQVQGEGSVEQVCAGLNFFSRDGWAQVVILARGGGSLEDLWTFNEEAVARAIAVSGVPVVSAIGHETDFTIADFVADQRAPTPSAAAEIVVCTRESLLEQIAGCRNKALQALRYRLLMASRDLHRLGTDRGARLIHRRILSVAQHGDELDDRLRKAQLATMEEHSRRLAELQRRLHGTDLRLRFTRIHHRSELLAQQLLKVMQVKLWKSRSRQEPVAAHLRQLSPLAVLERGYAIVEKLNGKIVRSAAETGQGEALRIRLHRGEIGVTVIRERPETDNPYTEA
ncbi:MAG: exodeoxyribonuclease VII large subunit [Acidobacteriota bacterium]|nr:exodeoxyribonuclease VII large subunit [Acidobacteriota bacterium]